MRAIIHGGRKDTRIPARARARHARVARQTAAAGRGEEMLSLVPHGFKPLLALSHGFQPLHSRPVQALSRPLPRIPFWL